jgi:epoxyqueuosine reductase
MVEKRLREWAAGRGYRLEVAGVEVVGEVLRKLEGRRADGMLDPAFYDEYLSWIKPLDETLMSGTKRVVAVVLPRPIHVLPVRVGGRVVETLIPPTYVLYKKTFDDVLADMKANALDDEDEAAILKVPLKSLAVHMGLTAYGRNNITYAAGFGSGLQVLGYVVGSPKAKARRAKRRAWPEGMLARCSTCRACVNVCPTGAIREDRFLISAERCYTLHSESRRPFPPGSKLPKSVCLIGCMDCQLVCPENRGRLKTAPSGVELSSEETEAVLLAGSGLEAAAGAEDQRESAARRSARAKFDRLGMTEDFEVMGRNLGMFLK